MTEDVVDQSRMHKATIVSTVLATLLVISVLVFQYPYRLGDFVRHNDDFRHWITRQIYCLRLRDSIVTKYNQRTSKAMDISVLSDIVDEYDMDENHEDDEHCIIHVRLGDVIDNHSRSVSDFVHGTNEGRITSGETMNGITWQGHSCNIFTTCNSEGYVKPVGYYITTVKQLPAHVKKIILVSGSHKPTLNPGKSQEYLQYLKKALQMSGYVVSVRWNRSADDDFVMLCRAKYLVVSGGGYSQLAAIVSKHRGNYMLQ